MVDLGLILTDLRAAETAIVTAQTRVGHGKCDCSICQMLSWARRELQEAIAEAPGLEFEDSE